jgi:hopene-associated glycosyltransferase HpnB
MHFTAHAALWLIAAASLCSWIYLYFARGGFWRISNVTFPSVSLSLKKAAPSVAVVIPARNEATLISVAVESLRQQDYPGHIRIVVVDDHSSDGTAEVMSGRYGGLVESVVVLSSLPLPSGWTGKMWALFQGVQHAMDSGPDYLFFSDADIRHSRTSIASLVARAESEKLALVSALPKLKCSTLAERVLLPAFTFYFFMLYPPSWVRNTKRTTAAAAGGNVLVRANTLADIGGIPQLRNELIDDCALAREIKKAGAIQLGWTENATSVRGYGGFGAVGNMISRNAYWQLRHSLPALIGSIAALTLVFVAPPVLTFAGGWCSAIAASAWILMSLAYVPSLKALSVATFWAPVLPFVTIFYIGATIHSAVQYYRGCGGEWKGRIHDVSRSTP